MFRVIALWSLPATGDEEAFARAYLNEHCPTARSLPSLKSLEITRAENVSQESKDDISFVAIMTWADRTAFEQDTRSAQWKAMRAHTADLETRFGVSLKYAFGSSHSV